jgi:uncharacterized protein YdaU (DUF1376 family)
MNFYEHHIGDYAEATAHLSFVEDAAYARLIRKYYATERPLPADPKALERLVGARTKDEKEAVRSVLEEFFRLEDDGWHNKRCDEELDRYHEKQAKARKSAEARWKRPDSERSASGMRTHPPSNATASKTHNGRNALQSPVPSPQSPDVLPPSSQDTRVITPTSPPHTSRGKPSEGSRPGSGAALSGDALTAEIQRAYPAGTYGAQNWLLAERCIRRLVEEGVPGEQLVDAAAKYCAQQEAKGDSIGTQYIRSPEKFFGEGFWRGPFPLPATKADTRLANNLSAADEFMRRTEAG